MIAVVDTDDRTFLLPDRLCQRTVIISNIIVAAEPLHILRDKIPAELLVFPKHILIHIALVAEGMATDLYKALSFQLPQLLIGAFFQRRRPMDCEKAVSIRL